MKRVIKLGLLLLLMMSFLGSSLYSKFNGRRTISAIEAANTKKVFKLYKRYSSLSKTKLEILPLEWPYTYEYIIFRKGARYYNSLGREISIDACRGLFLQDQMPKTYTFWDNKTRKHEFLMSGYYKKGMIDKNVIKNALNIAKTTEPIPKKWHKPYFEINNRNIIQEAVTVLAFRSDGRALQLQVEISPEFFPGERDLLNKIFNEIVTASNYRKMALTFMSTLFEGADRELFLQAAEITAAELYPIDQSMLREISIGQESLRRVFKERLTLQNETRQRNLKKLVMPYITPDSHTLDTLYMTKIEQQLERSVYFQSYFRFCYLKNKPILSNIIESELKRDNIDYNYKNYTPITIDEGNELARAALRYLTWGVEYTVNPRADIKQKINNNSVFTNNKTLIEEWCNNSTDVNLRSSYDNFFPYTNGFKTENINSLHLQTYPQLAKYESKLTFTSPFIEPPVTGKVPGNPIPYAPYGIDSPRTFNQKMYEQWKVKSWYVASRAGGRYINNSYKDSIAVPYYSSNYNNRIKGYSYITEYNIHKQNTILKHYKNRYFYKTTGSYIHPKYSDSDEIIKPFIPGQFFNSAKDKCHLTGNLKGGYNKSIYEPQKSAGVDSIGLLGGALAMTPMANSIDNLFNEKTIDKLNEYYMMNNANVLGLDSKGKPEFYAGNYLAGHYRLTPGDLEKMTIVVPSLKEVRVGDLVVNYDNPYEPHIGIVVAKEWGVNDNLDLLSARELREKLLVISVSSRQQMVSLEYWSNPTGKASNFAQIPAAYHVRRLMKKVGNSPYERKSNSYELLRNNIDGLSLDIILPDDRHNPKLKDHWIPNTAELLDGVKFKFIAIDKKGKGVDIDNNNVTLLPPLDQFFSSYNKHELQLSNRNLYINKGGGLEFGVNRGTIDKPDFLIISRFLRNQPGTLGSWDYIGEEYYKISSDSLYVNSEGEAINGSSLFIDSDGLLVFSLAGKEYREFAIRVYDDGNIRNIRPGDDFLFRFKINGLGKVRAKGEDFVAVYDKKALWRANLFIDERIQISGREQTPYIDENNNKIIPWDWNDAYKWNINSGNHKNLWNINVTNWAFPEYNGVMNIPNTTIGDGGQVVAIKPWTNALSKVSLTHYDRGQRFKIANELAPEEDITIGNAVAYSWGSVDSPFSFNWKMVKQKEALIAITNNQLYETPAPTSATHSYTYDRITTTFRSGVNKRWTYYVFGEPKNKPVALSHSKVRSTIVGKVSVKSILAKNTHITEAELLPLLDKKRYVILTDNKINIANHHSYEYRVFESVTDHTALQPYTPGLTSVLAHHHHASNIKFVYFVEKGLYDYIMGKQNITEIQRAQELKDSAIKLNFNFNEFHSSGLGDYHWEQARFSAGLDCSGLIFQGLSWALPKKDTNGNIIKNSAGRIEYDRFYDFPIIEVPATWDRDNVLRYGLKRGSTEITNDTKYTSEIGDFKVKNGNWTFKNINTLIPGDVVVKGGHIAFVHSITYTEKGGERVVDPDNTLMIEATGSGSYNKFRRVVCYKKLSDYLTDKKSYIVKRINVLPQ